ncbi:MAG: tetratricopeptide repeat protein [Brevinemataceae bacterium]
MQINYKGSASSKTESQAIQAFISGNYKTALELWNIVLEQDKTNSSALKGCALCAFIQKSDREAKDYLEEAQEYAANDPEILNLLALIYIRRGSIDEALNILLDGIEAKKDPLLQKTLEQIRRLHSPDHAKTISLQPLVRITLPYPKFSFKVLKEKIRSKLGIHTIWIGVGIVIFLGILFYPDLKNTAFRLQRKGFTPASQVTIKDIEYLVDMRENFKIILDEKLIKRKFEELKKAISDNQLNRARILANELLASNAGLGVKERVTVLEGFITDTDMDKIDYIPSYAEIAVAPLIYTKVAVRWKGTIANLHHQGRKKTTFDLLVNFVDTGVVEGIAAVEIEGFTDLQNGEKVTVIGSILGITKDNRIIIDAVRILSI